MANISDGLWIKRMYYSNTKEGCMPCIYIADGIRSKNRCATAVAAYCPAYYCHGIRYIGPLYYKQPPSEARLSCHCRSNIKVFSCFERLPKE